MISRRQFGILSATALAGSALCGDVQDSPPLLTRGVVLYPWDLTLSDWPERAARAGLTTIGLHAATRLDVLVDFVKSEQGAVFLGRCAKLGLHVEYELHAMGELLSRELYGQDTELFRVDQTGKRNADANCCPTSARALEIIAEKAVRLARILKPTTGRYFYWPDDGRDWCACPRCKGLRASDQSVLVENAIVAALREHIDPRSTLSHIAYHHTLKPPRQVRPHDGLFVEFAPISRVYDRAISERDVKLERKHPYPETHGGYLDALDANLEVFDKDSAQVLEYWLDVSRFSSWTRPARVLPWKPDVVESDVNLYKARGIRHITTFATWIDARYVNTYGEPPIGEYGGLLARGAG